MSHRHRPTGRYQREVGQLELLSYPDQLRLARTIEAGAQAARELVDLAGGGRTKGSHRPGGRDRQQLEALVDAGDRARRTLVEANLRLVMAEVRRYPVSTSRALVELVQAGNIGLVHAADRFDWRDGLRFSAYAHRWVHRAVARSWAESPDAAPAASTLSPAGSAPAGSAPVGSAPADPATSPELTAGGTPRPDPAALQRYRRRVALLDVDRDQPARSAGSLTGAATRSSAESPSGPIPWDRM